MSASLLRGAAVRQDGRSASLTAPNGQAQRNLLLAAHAEAGVRPTELARFEAHGTGTMLGDPIEAGSLAAAVLASVQESGGAAPSLGSVKANMGHGEPGAGMTGLLMLSWGLQQAAGAPNAMLRQLNPMVTEALHGAACAMPSQLGALPGASSGGPLRGGLVRRPI